MSKSFLAVFVTVVSVAGVAFAADRTMDKDDAKDTSSLTNFNVCGTTRYAITADDNYYITKTLRTINASTVAFDGGSLHLGKGTTGGCMAITRSSNSSIKFTANNAGLFVEKGRLVPYGNRIKLSLGGKITVSNAIANNFYIGSDGANNYGLTTDITGSLEGESDAYLNFRAAASNNVVYLSSAAAGETGWSGYAGTVKVGRINQSDYPITAEYRNNWMMPGKLIVDTDSYLYPQYGTSHATVGSLVLENGAILGGRIGTGDSATITVTKDVSVGRDIVWRYSSPLYAGNGYDVPFLVKKAEATGDLNPQNFRETTVDRIVHECLPRCWFVVTTAANGDETLSYVQPAVIQIKSDDKAIYGENFTHSSLVDLTMMQDGKTPHDDCDYVITKNGFAGNTGKDYQGSYLYTPTDLVNKPYEFNGKSLTIGTGCTFKSAANPLTIDTLRLTGNSWFFPRVGSSTATTLEGGEIFIGPEVADANGNLQPAMIDVYGKCVWTCRAALMGSGHLKFRANQGSSNPGGTVVLAGLSTNFLGKIVISSGSWDSTKLTASVNECVKVSDARQLGGALDAFAADALKLENWGTLEATDDVDFSTANRGVTIGNYGQMRVVSGKTLTIGNKVTLTGELHKAGTGTLAFGAAADAGTGAKLVVDAGAVQANVAAAFAGVDVSFANGTALLVDTTKDFGSKGVDLSGATTAVNVQFGFAADETEHELEAYPFCTVPEGVTVTVARPKRHFVKLTTKSNGDGTVTYLADVGVTGCAIILR